MRGDIWLYGGLKYDKSGHREGRYTRLDIGDGEHPITEVPRIYLKTHDGQSLFLPDVTELQLAEAGWPLIAPESWEQPQAGKHYSKEGCGFRFLDSVLVQIRIMGGYDSDRWPTPVLFGPDQTKAYSFPLSDQDALDLLGEPDRVVDGHFN